MTINKGNRFIKHCKAGEGLKDKRLTYLVDLVNNKSAKESLQQWIDERNAKHLSLKNTRSALYLNINFLNFHNKPIEKITKADNLKFFGQNKYSKNQRKQLKQFCKDLKLSNEIWEWIPINTKVEDQPEEKDGLTDEEVKKIIDSMDNFRDRTMFSILADSFPMRSIEIRNLKCKDVIFDDYGIVLKIYSKTTAGRRKIRLINSLPDFKIYWKTYPLKNEPEAPLFYNNNFMKGAEPIGWNAMGNALLKACKRAKIKRKIGTHDFRRYVATKLLRNEKYTTSEIKVMGGWSSLQMLDIYSRITSKMVTDKVLEINGKGKKEKPKEDLMKPTTCPFCNYQNSALNDMCDGCNKPLTTKGIEEYEKKREQEIENKMNKLLDKKLDVLLKAKNLIEKK